VLVCRSFVFVSGHNIVGLQIVTGKGYSVRLSGALVPIMSHNTRPLYLIVSQHTLPSMEAGSMSTIVTQNAARACHHAQMVTCEE
jgi:hypothetical protein